jgi:hypothetical protein
MKAWDIVGYSYQAETFCPEHIVEQLAEIDLDPVEHALDVLAQGRGIDRQDERSFDQSEFPKVIFASQVETPETCATCGKDLIDDFSG